MKKRILFLLLAAALALTGCGSFLNRDYSTSAPHSSSYFSADDPSVLRAESYQDLVNGLLMLISARAGEGTVWLYPTQDTSDPAETVGRACREVQQDTPMGSYAVEYLTYTIDTSAHNYNVVSLTIGYRRSAEQVAAMVHTTGVSALYDLLTAAVENGAEELAVQVSYFDQPQEEVRAAVAQLQLVLLAEEGEEPPEELPEDVEPWEVNFYPATGGTGIIEILLLNSQNAP